MPLLALKKWSVRSVADGKVMITSWMTDEEGVLINTFVLAKPNVGNNNNNNNQNDKRTVHRRYKIVVPASAIKPTEGTGGWSTSVLNDGIRVILTLGINNRDQDPLYPIQTPAEINKIIGSVGADAGTKKKKAKKATPDDVQSDDEQ